MPRQACYEENPDRGRREGRYQMQGDLLAAGSSAGCREVVMTNWDYFDLKLPRTTPKVLTLIDFGRCAKLEKGQIVSSPLRRWDAPPQGCVRHAELWGEVDWAKVAALVVP